MSGFLLVQTLPGREREVVDGLARVPNVVGKQVLFRENVAVKIECPVEAVDPTVSALQHMPGVVKAQLYRARFA